MIALVLMANVMSFAEASQGTAYSIPQQAVLLKGLHSYLGCSTGWHLNIYNVHVLLITKSGFALKANCFCKCCYLGRTHLLQWYSQAVHSCCLVQAPR